MDKSLLQGIRHLKKNDQVLSSVINKIGSCNLTPRKEYFQSLVRSIISQQISTSAATTIRERLFSKLNNEVNPDGILRLKENDFKKIGISPQKQKYLLDLSSKVKNKELDLEKISILGDEEVINQLVQVKGIGRWTAEMFLIFSLNRYNVLPVADLGLQKGIMHSYKLRKMPSAAKIQQISKKWGPYRSIGTWYMWQYMNNGLFKK